MGVSEDGATRVYFSIGAGVVFGDGTAVVLVVEIKIDANIKPLTRQICVINSAQHEGIPFEADGIQAWK